MVWYTLSLTIVLSYLGSAHCCGSLGFTCPDGYSCHIPDLDEYCPVSTPLMFPIYIHLQLRRLWFCAPHLVGSSQLFLSHCLCVLYLRLLLCLLLSPSHLLLKDGDYECCESAPDVSHECISICSCAASVSLSLSLQWNQTFCLWSALIPQILSLLCTQTCC